MAKSIVIIHLIEFLIFTCFAIYLCLISDIGHSNIQSPANRTLRNPSKFEYQVLIYDLLFYRDIISYVLYTWFEFQATLFTLSNSYRYTPLSAINDNSP